MITLRFVFTAILCISSTTLSQIDTTANVYVDTDGILRWNGSNNEVSLFGVNYTTPFAYAYRAHKRLGLSLKHAIDLDVAQW